MSATAKVVVVVDAATVVGATEPGTVEAGRPSVRTVLGTYYYAACCKNVLHEDPGRLEHAPSARGLYQKLLVCQYPAQSNPSVRDTGACSVPDRPLQARIEPPCGCSEGRHAPQPGSAGAPLCSLRIAVDLTTWPSRFQHGRSWMFSSLHVSMLLPAAITQLLSFHDSHTKFLVSVRCPAGHSEMTWPEVISKLAEVGLDDYAPKLKEEGYDSMDAFDASDKAAIEQIADEVRFDRMDWTPGITLTASLDVRARRLV